VHVDEDRVGAVAELRERGVGGRERRARGLQKEHPGEIHDGQSHPVLLDDRVPAARRRLGVVGRPHDPLLAVEQLVDLAVPVGVVAERDRVGTHLEQFARGLLGDPDATGRVLPVDHDEVRLMRVADAR